MKPYVRKAMQMMADAKPASGFRPETPEEWRRLQLATVEMKYAALREIGMPKKIARELAQAMMGGAAGMQLLDFAYCEFDDE